MGRKCQELGAKSWKCRTAMFGLWCNKLTELFLHFQDTVLYEGQAGSFPSLGGCHLLLSCQLIDAFKKMVFEFNMVFLPLFSGRICPHTIAHLF